MNNTASSKLQLQDAGFINVVETRYKWPQNSWPKDPKFKEIGILNFYFICLFFGFINARLGLTVECRRTITDKAIGMWTLENFTSGLSAFSMAFFTRVLGWSKEEVEVFLVDVRREMNNRKVHAYWPV